MTNAIGGDIAAGRYSDQNQTQIIETMGNRADWPRGPKFATDSNMSKMLVIPGNAWRHTISSRRPIVSRGLIPGKRSLIAITCGLAAGGRLIPEVGGHRGRNRRCERYRCPPVVHPARPPARRSHCIGQFRPEDWREMRLLPRS